MYAENTVERDRAYLVPLVWFGHPALWNHLHRVHFVGGEVCHLVASSKAALGGDKHEDQLKQQVENLQWPINKLDLSDPGINTYKAIKMSQLVLILF